MKYKDGVFTEVVKYIKGVPTKLVEHEKIVWAKKAADLLSNDYFGKEIVVTSILDGKHSKRSLHYEGKAFDIRRWIYTETQLIQFIELLEEELGDDFDVVLEATHIHIEYDPK